MLVLNISSLLTSYQSCLFRTAYNVLLI